MKLHSIYCARAHVCTIVYNREFFTSKALQAGFETLKLNFYLWQPARIISNLPD